MADNDKGLLPPKKDGDRSPVELGIIAGVVVYVIALIASNRDKVSLDFVFFSQKASLVVIIVLAAVLGFAGGYFAHRSRS